MLWFDSWPRRRKRCCESIQDRALLDLSISCGKVIVPNPQPACDYGTFGFHRVPSAAEGSRLVLDHAGDNHAATTTVDDGTSWDGVRNRRGLSSPGCPRRVTPAQFFRRARRPANFDRAIPHGNGAASTIPADDACAHCRPQSGNARSQSLDGDGSTLESAQATQRSKEMAASDCSHISQKPRGNRRP